MTKESATNTSLTFTNVKPIHKGLDMKKVILLDNQSTVDLFCNSNMVTDIVKVKESIRVQSTGGYLVVRHKATLPGYGKQVWYNKDGITNILSMKNVREGNRIEYDCAAGVYTVVRKDRHNLEFKMIDEGLHVHIPGDKGLAFANIFPENKDSLSRRQLKGAQAARE